MSPEIKPIKQIEQERDYLSQSIVKREAFIDCVGSGTVKIGSSFENTLKVGRIKGMAKASILRMQERRDDLDQEVIAYNQACDHLGEISLRQTQLSEINQMVTDGNLPLNIFQLHQQQLQELVSLSQTDPILIRGIKRIQLEEEARKKEQSKPLEEVEESEKYRLPNGQEVSGKIAQLLHLLDGTSFDNILSSDQITQTIWPDVDNKSARNRLGIVISKFRKFFPNNGLDIVVEIDPAKRYGGQKGSYYSIISNQTATEETVDLLPKFSYVDQKIDSINKPEYGTLSRADIGSIASAIIYYTEDLNPFLESSNVRLIDQSILTQLQNLTGGTPLANFDKLTTKEHCQFANQFRIQALKKVQKLIESPEVNQILDNISFQDSNVWCLLVNLSEMDKVGGMVQNDLTVKHGIDFLIDLLANPEARKQGFLVKVNPTDTPKLPLNQTDTAILDHKPQMILIEETPNVEVLSVPILPIIPEVPQTEIKPKAIETYDPSIRIRINDFLDQISEHPELVLASPGMITRAFPRLKQKTIDQTIEDGYISGEQDHNGNKRFNSTEIAILLYLCDFGRNLQGRLKKQIEDIVAEEINKRQRK